MIRRPPRSPLFPYTTLSRSGESRLSLKRLEVGELGSDQGRGHEVAGARRDPLGRGRLVDDEVQKPDPADRKSTRLNSSHSQISYAVFCLKKKKTPANAQLAA